MIVAKAFQLYKESEPSRRLRDQICDMSPAFSPFKEHTIDRIVDWDYKHCQNQTHYWDRTSICVKIRSVHEWASKVFMNARKERGGLVLLAEVCIDIVPVVDCSQRCSALVGVFCQWLPALDQKRLHGDDGRLHERDSLHHSFVVHFDISFAPATVNPVGAGKWIKDKQTKIGLIWCYLSLREVRWGRGCDASDASCSKYSEDPISGTVYKWDSYVNGRVLEKPKFIIPYDIQFISGILM